MTISACTTKQPIEFLGFEGCPNTPILLDRLRAASPESKIVEVDLMKLQTGDAHLGWGAPTILVDGEDLFGLAPSSDRAVSCRNWSQGLPEIEVIRKALKERQQ
ncbi:MAG: hypothetical protein H8E91_07445 [Planctomycetes bacterium]|nr:hypothetical protein [Planctomycetota bacterium]